MPRTVIAIVFAAFAIAACAARQPPSAPHADEWGEQVDYEDNCIVDPSYLDAGKGAQGGK
jgi:hypothetical protein